MTLIERLRLGGPNAMEVVGEAADEIERLQRDIACRPDSLGLLYRIREGLGFNKYFPLSHLDTRAKAIHDALCEMLDTHGKPMREEWINDAAFEHAKKVDFRARDAVNRHQSPR